MGPSFDIQGNLKPYDRIRLDVKDFRSTFVDLFTYTESDILYWNDWFTKSRKDKRGKRYPKGYVELEFKVKNLR